MDKETSREQAYNQDFFIKILGYKEKPATPFSFEPKATTDKGQLPDAVLGYTDAAEDIKNIAAVVELKGASIELDRPQRRDGNMSPVQQGFKYKTQYRNCPFVVVSNFWEFRLYHDNQLDYELWTLDDLVDPSDDYLKFKIFYTLMHSDNLTTPKGASKTEGWLSDIRFEQEEIGKKFYKVYREARLELLRDIYRHNENVRTDISLGIEKAQKIIDRIVFACFAEDRGLLPDDTLKRVIQSADNSAFGGSLWSTFKAFFEAIDVGSDKLEIPDGYNGGLFAPDQALNSLNVSDEPLRKVANIGDYNFVEDLSVNILGHIFEQSISDLEEIKSKVEESQNLDSIQQSRRKKDGIFYTPDYIVRYIVDNSLGAYLREEEERLKVEFKLKGDISDKSYEKRERQAYNKYQEFLQNVKVVDPACGSGAFLVYVFDYLLAENKRVASILGNTLFGSDVYVKGILENNIYGVDLNDESVEITKLSLWLKSAQKGKKLTTLDSNIKCGNSLIDDPEKAGDKAFNWQEQFPEIFKNGGFDVVVGNPPYVMLPPNNFTKYSLTSGNNNTYIAFVELCLKTLLEKSGKLGFIIPNTWFGGDNFAKFREFAISENSLREIIQLPYDIFEAYIDTAMVFIDRAKANKHTRIYRYDIRNYQRRIESLDTRIFPNDEWLRYGKIFLNTDILKIGKKVWLSKSTVPLGLISKINRGCLPPKDFEKNLFKTEEYNLRWYDNQIFRYSDVGDSKVFVNYDKLRENKPIETYMGKRLLARQLMSRQFRINVSIIEYDCAFKKNLYVIQRLNEDYCYEYILAVLNSKLFSFAQVNFNTSLQRDDFPAFSLKDFKSFQIPMVSTEKQEPFVRLANELLVNNAKLREYSLKFVALIHSEHPSIKLFDGWWNLDFSSFYTKLKTKLSLSQRDELLQLFEKYRTELSQLDAEIQKTDAEIDQLVYKLYNLTPEEIKIIESKT